jgi:hypothetical protein
MPTVALGLGSLSSTEYGCGVRGWSFVGVKNGRIVNIVACLNVVQRMKMRGDSPLRADLQMYELHSKFDKF